MTRQRLMLLAAVGSALLLGGAYLFEYAGYPPCRMCYWQRWPHMVAIGIGLVALVLPLRALAWAGALAAGTTACIGVYHTGVERRWWPGPSSCTGSGDLSGDLLSLDGPRLIMCDQVSWELFTLSMPSWNALFSASFALIWVVAALRRSS